MPPPVRRVPERSRTRSSTVRWFEQPPPLRATRARTCSWRAKGLCRTQPRHPCSLHCRHPLIGRAPGQQRRTSEWRLRPKPPRPRCRCWTHHCRRADPSNAGVRRRWSDRFGGPDPCRLNSIGRQPLWPPAAYLGWRCPACTSALRTVQRWSLRRSLPQTLVLSSWFVSLLFGFPAQAEPWQTPCRPHGTPAYSPRQGSDSPPRSSAVVFSEQPGIGHRRCPTFA